VDDIYHTGWLVFETVSGDEKRRLGRYPQRWANGSEQELRALLAQAERVRGGSPDAQRAEDRSSPSRDDDRSQPGPAAGVNAPQQARTFRYPNGRYWTVAVVVRQEDGERSALRFTAGARNIELETWPEEWADLTDEQLVELLRWAAPRSSTGAPAPGTPRRRWDDRPELGR
jgi:hypothetical protein